MKANIEHEMNFFTFVDYGPALIEHCLILAGLPVNARLGHEFIPDSHIPQLLKAFEVCLNYFHLFSLVSTVIKGRWTFRF